MLYHCFARNHQQLTRDENIKTITQGMRKDCYKFPSNLHLPVQAYQLTSEWNNRPCS